MIVETRRLSGRFEAAATGIEINTNGEGRKCVGSKYDWFGSCPPNVEIESSQESLLLCRLFILYFVVASEFKLLEYVLRDGRGWPVRASPPKLRRSMDQTSTFVQNHQGAQGQGLIAVIGEMRPENITHTYKVHSNKL